MSKRAFGVSAVLTLLVALGTVAVKAQSQRSRITIPFTFVAAGKILPAGEYTFGPNSKDSFHVWVLAGQKNGDAVLFPTVPLRARQTQEDTKLIFSKYYDQYFLSEIWTAGEQNGYKVNVSPQEQRLVKNGAHREQVVVSLGN